MDGGEQVASWSSGDADALRVMADGADGVADALVKRYAKVPLTGTPGSIELELMVSVVLTITCVCLLHCRGFLWYAALFL